MIYCSDPRYRPHFQDFIENGLGVRHYAAVAIPGGPQTLTLAEYLPKFAWSGWRWIKFLVTLTKLERLILIAHDDCRWYIENRFADAPQLRAKQIHDLRAVRDAVAERFPAVRCELFRAQLDGTSAAFESIGEQPRVT